MNVAHVTTVHPRYDTRIFIKECASLYKSNVGNVELVVADGKGNEIKNGINIHDIGKPFFGRLGRFFLGYLRLWLYFRKRKYDLVHFHDPELIVFFYIYSFFNENVIFDMHENVPKQILQKEWVSSYLKNVLIFFYRGVEKFCLKRFSIVFAESSYERDYIWLINNIRSVVVQNMPIIQLIPRSSISKSHSVGYIGGVTKERGILNIVESLDILKKQGYNVSFLCIGPVSESVNNSLGFSRGISDGWINSPGRLEGPEGWKLVSSCNLGVAVLDNLPNYVESWPTKVFEYMTMGIPVVVSDFPLYRELIENVGCGILVDPKNTTDIANAVKWLIENSDEALEMGGRGRKAVERYYNWDLEKNKLIGLYKDIGICVNNS